MTDIQHESIINYLTEKGYECIPISSPNGELIFLDIMVAISENEMRLRIEFLNSFPYTFPRIFLLKEFYKDIAPIPHVDYLYKNGYHICTYDSNVSLPNHNEPCKLVDESIKKSISIIEDGISYRNREDFIEEFTSYWEIDLNGNQNVFTLFNPGDKPQNLYYYNNSYQNFYVSDNKESLKEWIKYTLQINLEKKEIERCLYLPIQNPWYPPYPRTDREIYLKVKEDKNFNAYYKFLTNRADKSLIIFSQKYNDNKYLASWLHSYVKPSKGFRKGKINPGFTYAIQNKNRKIFKLGVNRVDRERLFKRGGDSQMVDYKVTITGCGSIGSYLIQALSELGVYDYKLIDNDIIKSDNIARHTCGASDIGKFKTDAIKEMMIRHSPYMKIESFSEDVFNILDKKIDIYVNCDINFIVVGNISIEAKFIELFNSGKINKPIILIWVEPFLLGGHAVLIQQKQEVFPLLFNEDYSFKHSIIVDGTNYTKKEAGCNSTYIPYSAFEAKQFVYSFIDFFHNNTQINLHGNHLFSWCGNLKWARAEGIKISDYWISKRNREVRLQRLDEV